MPVGRVYQAPTTLNTVARNTPVYGFNGIKTVSNSDLVITGKAVRSTKSKSKSPSPGPNTLTLSSSNSSISSSKQLTATNGTKKLSRKSKSPSPRKTTQLKSSKCRTESKNDATVVETDNNNSVKHDSSSSNNNGSVSAKTSPEQNRKIKATSIAEDWNNNQHASPTLNNDNEKDVPKAKSSTKTQV